ncbi:hypothetical protein HPO96_31385 [Kribbella sandramycini]|uniref:Uncharacterized protein n=1 Tax=Kribbella sandramycini TaxID=60450 RepID=A0A7Y4P376_9ACTN|nr:hypothetical protein [Kribbella sandramycini]MBB6567042.1 hypothetical protein [Kribbella sandramycini]NOL44763.1 hypothetical protein [Kribbella sandramycini]
MNVGRTPDSEIPDVGNGLWERIRDAVQAESGAETSLWNGQLDYTNNANRGETWEDGRMCLNRADVVEPLQEMYATAGQPATPEQWIKRRNALKTVIHEYSHVTAPDGHTHADREAQLRRGLARPIEEGVTEAWSQDVVDRVAVRVLPAEMAEQIKAVRDVRGPHAYPAWEPAARSLAGRVGADVGLDGTEVLRRMSAETLEGKARVVADLLYDASDLPNVVPPSEEQTVREEISDWIQGKFAELDALYWDPRANRDAISKQRGLEIAAGASDVVRDAEKFYRTWHHPTQELDKLRGVLEGQAPAAGAPRVPQGEAAQGRRTAQPVEQIATRGTPAR